MYDNMRVIAISNQKGGVGKTTTSVNVARYISKTGKKVLLIDADPQGNTSTAIGIDKHLTGTYEAMVSKDSIVDSIQKTKYPNLDGLSANTNLAAVELEISGFPNREFVLKKLIGQLKYDIVIIDCPPSLGLLTINALTASTDIVIPVQTEYFALEGLTQLLTTIHQVKKVLNPDINLLGVVMTMHNDRMSLSNQVKTELDSHLGEKLFKSSIPRNVRLAEAPSFGKPIADYDKYSKGARMYKKLSGEILERIYGK